VYGTKNVYTAAIRAYAAYHADNRQVYELAMLTFAGVLVLYVLELLVYRTVRVKEFAFPMVTAGSGLVWMWLQRDWYLV
jgi:ABC-type branched-subunit amino acid transport system permease subunit